MFVRSETDYYFTIEEFRERGPFIRERASGHLYEVTHIKIHTTNNELGWMSVQGRPISKAGRRKDRFKIINHKDIEPYELGK